MEWLASRKTLTSIISRRCTNSADVMIDVILFSSSLSSNGCEWQVVLRSVPVCMPVCVCVLGGRGEGGGVGDAL